MKDSLHAECVERGIECDNHKSDLYIPVTPETTALCSQFGHEPTKFIHQGRAGMEQWYDVPFAFVPWWVQRQ